MRLRTLRTLGVALLVLMLVLAVAFAAVVSTIDVNRYKGLIAQKVTEATGRTLEIQGELRLTFLSLAPSVQVEGVSLANAPWGSAPRMVALRRLEAQVALLPLLRRQVHVKRLILVEPEILLETDPKGRRNWDFFPEKRERSPAGNGGSVSAFHMTKVHVKGGRFTYRDATSGRTTALRIDRLSILARSLDGPLRLEAKGVYNQAPIQAKVALGSLTALLGNATLPLTATVKVSGAELTVEGSVARPHEGGGIALAVAFRTDSLQRLSRLAGQSLPPRGPIRLTAKVSEENRTFRVRDLRATVGKSDLAGEFTLALDGRPRLSGRLVSRLLDLADLLPPTADEPADPRRLFPEAPLPVAGLRAFDAHLSLAVERLRAGGVALEQVGLAVTLRDGRLASGPLRARLAGGAVAGDLTLDARQTPARFTTRLDGRQVDVGRLLEEAGRKNILSGGKTDASLELRGGGDTLRTVLARLDGHILVTMGEARIENSAVERLGADLVTGLARTLNPFASKEAYTHLQCGVLRLDVKDGVATTDRGFAAETRKINMAGSGAVNLGTEELDVALRPEAREGLGIGAGSLAPLVRVRGTLAAPKLQLTPEGLVKVSASLGAAVATGGISLLAQGLLQRTDDSPCATALGQTARARTAPSGKRQAAPVQKAEPRDAGFGGLLKGLPGRFERLRSGEGQAEAPPPATRGGTPNSP